LPCVGLLGSYGTIVFLCCLMTEYMKKKHLSMRTPFGQQDGIALLVVLWVMAILSVIVGQFCYSMRTGINITRNFKDSSKAYYLARAGIQQALFHLLVLDKSDGDVTETENRLLWRVNADNPPIVLAEGSFSVRIGNVSGRININMANGELLELMLSGIAMDDESRKIIVDSIQDWRDADDFHRLNGAENSYYQFLPEPYSCRNSPFLSIEDLLLVRGMTGEIFSAIQGVVTVYPRKTGKNIAQERNNRVRTRRGKKKGKRISMEQKKVNINAAPPAVLAILPGMTDRLVKNIIDFRSDTDFQSLAEVRAVIGEETYQQLARYISLKNSTYYSVTSRGRVVDSKVVQTVYTVVDIDADRREYRYVKWMDTLKGI